MRISPSMTRATGQCISVIQPPPASRPHQLPTRTRTNPSVLPTTPMSSARLSPASGQDRPVTQQTVASRRKHSAHVTTTYVLLPVTTVLCVCLGRGSGRSQSITPRRLAASPPSNLARGRTITAMLPIGVLSPTRLRAVGHPRPDTHTEGAARPLSRDARPYETCYPVTGCLASHNNHGVRWDHVPVVTQTCRVPRTPYLHTIL